MSLNIRKIIVLFSLLVVLIPLPCYGRLEEDEEIIKSFMPGVIRRVAVRPGQQVKRGDLLCIIEAMKMECSITSPREGFIGSLYFTVDQCIENGMPLISILLFMPIEKEGDPMDVDESPLPTSQDNEPSLKDLSQENVFVVSSSVEKLISEIGVKPETYHQEETLLLVAASLTEILNNEEDVSDVSSSKVVTTRPIEQSVSEDELQRSEQEETLLLVAAPITEETFDNEGKEADFSLFEIESEISQQEQTFPLIVEPIIEALNTEENVFDVSQSESVTVAPVEQLAFGIEIEPETSQEEQTFPLVVASIPEIFNNEGEGADLSLSETESEISQQEQTFPLIVEPIIEALNTEENVFDISPSESVTVAPMEHLTSEIEVELQASQQEVKLPLIITSIMDILNTEENIFDVSSSSDVIAGKEKKSILEHQAFHQVPAPFWIASVSSHHGNALTEGGTEAFNDGEFDTSSSSQKVKAEEFQHGVNIPKAPTYLFWLTRLILLAFLSFCRPRGIMPYRIRNILTPKIAENLNIPGYLRDAA